MYFHINLRRPPGRTLGVFSAVALPVLITLSLAAIPTAPAAAAGTSSEAEVVLNVPAEQLESIVGGLSKGDLEAGSGGLHALLGSLPALSGLSSERLGLLETALGLLPASTPVNTVLSDILGTLGVHVTPAELFSALEGSLDNPSEVAKFLSDLAGALSPTQLGELQGVLGKLVGNLQTGELTGLEGTLSGLLGGLGTSKLSSLLTPLEGGLSGTGLTQLQTLLASLSTLSVPELKVKLEELLGQLDPTQVGTLLGGLFGKVGPEQLQGVLGELLGSLDFTQGNAGEVAEGLGITLEDLASQLGVESKDLPSDVTALTAPLSKEGSLLSLLDGLGGLNISLLGGKETSGKGGSGGNGGAGGNGGSEGNGSSGGNGGSGGGSSNPPTGAGSTTLALSLTSTPASTPTAGTSSKSKSTTKKVKILSYKVKGDVATLVVQVPSAGRLTVSGSSLRGSARQVSRAERVTLKVRLTSAGSASLRRHHRMRDKLKVVFKPVSGGASSATAEVTFR